MNPKYNNQEGNLDAGGLDDASLDFSNRLSKYEKLTQGAAIEAFNETFKCFITTAGMGGMMSTNTEVENEIERNKNLNSGNKNQQY